MRKNLRVKLVDVLKMRSETKGLVLDVGVRQELARPPNYRAHGTLDYSVFAVDKQAPEFGKAVAAGEPARHSDDCYGLLTREMIAIGAVALRENIIGWT